MKAAASPVPKSLKKVIRMIDERNVTFQPPMRVNAYSSTNCRLASGRTCLSAASSPSLTNAAKGPASVDLGCTGSGMLKANVIAAPSCCLCLGHRLIRPPQMVGTPERVTTATKGMRTPPNQQPRPRTPRAPIRKTRLCFPARAPSPALAALVENMGLESPREHAEE